MSQAVDNDSVTHNPINHHPLMWICDSHCVCVCFYGPQGTAVGMDPDGCFLHMTSSRQQWGKTRITAQNNNYGTVMSAFHLERTPEPHHALVMHIKLCLFHKTITRIVFKNDHMTMIKVTNRDICIVVVFQVLTKSCGTQNDSNSIDLS